MNIPEHCPPEIRCTIYQLVEHPASHLINVLVTRKVKYGIDTQSFAKWYFENEV